MEIKFRAPHGIDAIYAIDATLSPQSRRLDGVEAHEGPRNIPNSLVDFHTVADGLGARLRIFVRVVDVAVRVAVRCDVTIKTP